MSISQYRTSSALDSVASVQPPVAPGGLPLLGHLPFLLRDPLAFMTSLQRVGKVARIHLGSRPMYFLNDLKLVYDVVVNDVEKFPRGVIFDKAKRVLGRGLTVSEGPEHLRHRKIIQPSLAPKRIEHYTTAMIDVAMATTSAWRAEKSLNVNHATHYLGLAIFTRVLFGRELNDDAVKMVQKATPSFMAGIVAQSLYPVVWLEKIPLPVNIRLKQARREMECAVEDIIVAARHAWSSGKPTDTPTILTMLMPLALQDSDVFDELQLRDEIINLVVAGAEAPGTTLAWALYELSQHPDIERRILSEMHEAMSDGELTYESLGKLHYTKAFIKETLRMHTPTWLLTRRANADVTLGGFTIPADSEVAFSLTALHRVCEDFGDPAAFDPVRWLDGRDRNLKPYSYMPMLQGKHRCLGEHLSTQIILVALVAMLTKWRFLPPRRKVKERCVALVQASNLRMDLVPR